MECIYPRPFFSSAANTNVDDAPAAVAGFDDDVRLRGPHGCVQGLPIERTHRVAYAVESAGPVPTFVQSTRLFDESLDLFDLDIEQFRQPVQLLVPDQIFREVLFSMVCFEKGKFHWHTEIGHTSANGKPQSLKKV